MTPDYLSYRRAASISLLGVVVHLLLGASLVVYSLLSKDHAGLTGGVFIILGSLVWLGLAIVFDQHRRERLEALEASNLEAGQVGSVFDKSEEFRPAARRLAAMHKVFLPALSLVLAAAYIAVGAWRVSTVGDRLNRIPEQLNLGWGLGLCVAIAIFGFFLARYAAGMSRQKVWANMRGGAAASVGAAVAGILLVSGYFTDFAGPDVVSRYLQVVIPGLMVVLGVEIVLNFLLNLYRPRKPGEVPRPAFDSRLLSLIAAPDTVAKSIGEAITYQLGYDVTGNWFYQLLSRLVLPLVGLGALILWGLSCLTVVEPHQRALVTRFGALVREIEPGLHFKAPWPIDRVHVPVYYSYDPEAKRRRIVGRTATGVRVLQIGTQPSARPGAVLWTNIHAGEEIYFIVQPAADATQAPDPAAARQRDVALVGTEAALQYAVSDVVAFESLAPPAQRDELLRSVAQRELLDFLSALRIDEILGSARNDLGPRLKRRIEAAFAALNPDENGVPRGAGVEIITLTLTNIHPPQDAAPSFQRVFEAEQKHAQRMELAMAHRISTLTAQVGSVERAEQIVREIEALNAMSGRASEEEMTEQRFRIQKLLEESSGQAAKTIAEAAADRWTKHMSERGRAMRYQGLLASYEASPELFRASLYFDALRDSMADNRLFITDDRVGNFWFTGELQQRDTGVDVFRGEGQ